MGLTGAISLGLGLMQAGSQYAQGVAASTEAKYNARIKEQQASMITAAQGIEASQYDRQMGRAGAAAVASTAKSGITMSGSPMTVLIDTQTQMEMDKAIGQYNYEVQKRFALSQAEAYNREAKYKKQQAAMSAFSTLLTTGFDAFSSMPKPELTKTITSPKLAGSFQPKLPKGMYAKDVARFGRGI